MVEKAVILAAGAGSRMRASGADPDLRSDQRAAAEAGHKGLMPFDRPFLDYVVAALAEAGIVDVCLVVGPGGTALEDYVASRRGGRMRFTTAVQPVPRGTADALARAAPFTAADTFLVLNSDTFYPATALCALAQLDGMGLLAVERSATLKDPRTNLTAARLASFAVLTLDADGSVRAIVEKPPREAYERLPDPLWLSVNGWRLGPEIYRFCAELEPSPRGELELPAAAQAAIEAGAILRIAPASGLLDLSTRADVAEVGRLLGAGAGGERAVDA